MSDDWRVRIDLDEEGAARELTDRLEAFNLAHDLRSSFHDRVIVSRDGPTVFCYAEDREQAAAAERAVQALAREHDWRLEAVLERWHPAAAEWADADAPLPETAAQQQAEHRELIESQREESASQGFPEFEVRVTCGSVGDARALAERLEREGIAAVQRWQFLVLGAADQDSAAQLAARVRDEAPAGSQVDVQGSIAEVAGGAPYGTPFSPFAVFGGLGG
jgi:hypothetical protein